MKDNVTLKVKELLKCFNALSDDEKLGVIAILIKHWDKGFINSDNSLNYEECIENGGTVFLPQDIDYFNILDLAKMIILYIYKDRDIIISNDDIEKYIKQTKSIKKVLSKFYELSLYDKLDSIAEMFYSIVEIIDYDINYDVNDLIEEILSYQNNLLV